MSGRRAALWRLGAVVVLFGAGAALVSFGVLVAGGELARSALGASRRADLAVAALGGLVGGELMVGAIVVGLGGRSTGGES